MSDLLARKIKTLFPAVMLSTLTGLALVFCVLLSELTIHSQNMLISLSLPTVGALFLLPYILNSYIGMQRYKLKNDSSKASIIFGILGGVFFIAYYMYLAPDVTSQIKIQLITHYLCAAFCEEYLYRGVIFGDLRSKTRLPVAILVSSLLFAFLGHIGDDFIDNLRYRLPLGIAFCLIRYKTNSITASTVVHAAYNLMLISIGE